MRKVYKYGTGQDVPKDAVYLTTLVEEIMFSGSEPGATIYKKRLVWHYFLIEESLSPEGKNNLK